MGSAYYAVMRDTRTSKVALFIMFVFFGCAQQSTDPTQSKDVPYETVPLQWQGGDLRDSYAFNSPLLVFGPYLRDGDSYLRSRTQRTIPDDAVIAIKGGTRLTGTASISDSQFSYRDTSYYKTAEGDTISTIIVLPDSGFHLVGNWSVHDSNTVVFNSTDTLLYQVTDKALFLRKCNIVESSPIKVDVTLILKK